MIKRQYFGNGNDINDLEVLQNLTNSFTDSGFFYGTDKMARYIIEGGRKRGVGGRL